MSTLKRYYIKVCEISTIYRACLKGKNIKGVRDQFVILRTLDKFDCIQISIFVFCQLLTMPINCIARKSRLRPIDAVQSVQFQVTLSQRTLSTAF